ncbi:MAG: glutamate--tRNA ligase, partial [Pyrinomonadaceae bacterium]
KNLKKHPELQTLMPELASRLEKLEEFTHEHIEQAIRNFAEEKQISFGVIMNAARTLLTGTAVGPSMLAVFELLGKERSVMRLKSQIPWNQN